MPVFGMLYFAKKKKVPYFPRKSFSKFFQLKHFCIRLLSRKKWILQKLIIITMSVFPFKIEMLRWKPGTPEFKGFVLTLNYNHKIAVLIEIDNFRWFFTQSSSHPNIYVDEIKLYSLISTIGKLFLFRLFIDNFSAFF